MQRARLTGSVLAPRALSELCELCRYPLYAFVRRSGHTPAEALDRTQGIFADFLARGAGRLAGAIPPSPLSQSYHSATPFS